MIEKPLYVLGILALVFCLTVASGFAALIKLQGNNTKLSITPGDVIIAPTGQEFIYQHYINSTNTIRYLLMPEQATDLAKPNSVIDLGNYRLHIVNVYRNGTIVVYAEAVRKSSSNPVLSGLERFLLNPLGFLNSIAPKVHVGLLNMLLDYYITTSSTQSVMGSSGSTHANAITNKGTNKNGQSTGSESFSVRLYNGQTIVFGNGCGTIELLGVNSNTKYNPAADIQVNGATNHMKGGQVQEGESFTLCNGDVSVTISRVVRITNPIEILSTGYTSYIIIKGRLSNGLNWSIVNGTFNKSTTTQTNNGNKVYINLGETKCLHGVCVNLYPKTTIKIDQYKIVEYQPKNENIIQKIKDWIFHEKYYKMVPKTRTGLFPIITNDNVASMLVSGLFNKFFYITPTYDAYVFNITPVNNKEVAFEYDGQIPIQENHETYNVNEKKTITVDVGDNINICKGALILEIEPTKKSLLYPTDVMEKGILGVIDKKDNMFIEVLPSWIDPVTIMSSMNLVYDLNSKKIQHTMTAFSSTYQYIVNETTGDYANISVNNIEVFSLNNKLYIRVKLTIDPHCNPSTNLNNNNPSSNNPSQSTPSLSEPNNNNPTSNTNHINVNLRAGQEIVFTNDCGRVKVWKILNNTELELQVFDNGQSMFNGTASVGETFTICNGEVTIVPTSIESNEVVFKGVASNHITWKIVAGTSNKATTSATLNPGQYTCFGSECVKVFATEAGDVVSLNNGTGPGIGLMVNDTYPSVMYIKMISGSFPTGEFDVITAKQTSNGVEIHHYIAQLVADNKVVKVSTPETVTLENGDEIEACNGNITIPIGGALHAAVGGPYVGVFDPSGNGFYPTEQRNTTNLWPSGDLYINGQTGYLYPIQEGQSVTVINQTTGQKLQIKIQNIDYVLDPTTNQLKLMVHAYVNPEC